MTAVEVRNLTKTYAGVTALTDVSFTLARGLVYGVLGANGSGKSTLLRVLATLERPTAGTVSILGQNTEANPRAVRRQIGFVPDAFSAQPGLTVREHLQLVAACHGLRGRERRAAVDVMLQLVDLADGQESDASGLSRGQRQRLALASAMVHDPAVLILDEPLAGLDPVGRSEMLEILKELRAMGKAIVLSSHNLAEIQQLCDGIGLLNKGSLLASGPLAEMFAEESPPSRVIKMEVAAGIDGARAALMATREARDISLEGNFLTFLIEGDDAVVPGLLERLLQAGVQIRRFSMEGPQVDEALVRTLQDLAA